MPSSLLPFSLLPQNQIIMDDNKTLMPSSSPNKPMDQIQTKPDPHPLKCPRCDSSNTKFCYYNNYSLSQPRHFCKACKRYWTRGGTLRNVPVGGGCRKNKRSSSKRPDAAPAAATAATTVQRPPLDLSTSATHSNRIHNPLFYNPVELNFPFSGSRVLSTDTFDLHHHHHSSQMSGFSSGLPGPTDHHHQNGFKPIQDHFPGNHNSIFFGSSNLTSSSAMASLLAMKSGGVVVPGLMPYDDPQMTGKDVKVEGWNPNPNPNQNQNPIHEQINISNSDPSNSLVWNSTWFDPSSMGSNSVPSLI